MTNRITIALLILSYAALYFRVLFKIRRGDYDGPKRTPIPRGEYGQTD
jgi:hypothetical protein